MESRKAAAPPELTDKVFAKPRKAEDFQFSKETAVVFDDMVSRSVPFYGEMQRMVGELVADFATPESNVYDLGCATATTFQVLQQHLPKDLNVRFVGIDNSQPMLDQARKKLEESKFPWDYDLQYGDLNQGISIHNASVTLLVLTLQFVRPLHRDNLLAAIARGTNPNGCVILIEKVLGEHSTFNRLFIKHYYDMKKRNGYSEMEIAQKREALENVLIPYRLEENKELLGRAGFNHFDVFFKWYNFCGFIAFK
jgi:tRNA (cmo5U34)-methyltransferase